MHYTTAVSARSLLISMTKTPAVGTSEQGLIVVSARLSRKMNWGPVFLPGFSPANLAACVPEVEIKAIDLFCGAGGSSWGAFKARVDVVAAFDRWDLAAKTHKINFPKTKFFGGKLENRNLRKLKRKLGRIDLILSSPECTSHS